VIREDDLPLSSAYRALAGKDGTRHALTGGEDYELLFCARRPNRARIEKLRARAGVAITRIGACVAGKNVVILDRFEKPVRLVHRGHDHFKAS
jgi:thiamine-monophosphate kinase